MNTSVLDSRRRLVMPPELPARSPVIVQQIDGDTWLVKRARPTPSRMVLLAPDIHQLPNHLEWNEIESAIVAFNSQSPERFDE